jgi:tetraacyldisaccharide 4'-kinase
MTSSMESLWAERGVEAWLFSPLGALYACGWWAYESVYRLGLKRAAEPPLPILTIGNLVAGGAGKTPLALSVCALLHKRGRPVAISMSGYGSRRYRSPAIAPAGPLDPAEWGDEPAMARLQQPDLAIVVGKDRVEAARLTSRALPGAVLVLDDGFQHLRLRQDNAVVIDLPTPNRFCLPAGPYREPRSTGLRRAALVVPNERFEVVRSATTLVQVHGDPIAEPEEVDLLVAIARPYRVVVALEQAGYRLREVQLLADHADLAKGTLPGDEKTPLVLTAKDWVKLRRRDDLGERTVFVADYRAWIEPEDQFAAWLESRLEPNLP